MTVGRLRAGVLTTALLQALVLTKLWLYYRHSPDSLECWDRGGTIVNGTCVGADANWAQRGRALVALLGWVTLVVLAVLTARAVAWRDVPARYSRSPRLRAGLLIASVLAAVLATWVWWLYAHMPVELFCLGDARSAANGCLPDPTDWAQRGCGWLAVVLWVSSAVLLALEVRIRHRAGRATPAVPVG